MFLTHKHRVSCPSLPQSRRKRLNLDTNLYVDTVPHLPPRLIHNPYILEMEYPYKEYHQLLTEQQHIGWDKSVPFEEEEEEETTQCIPDSNRFYLHCSSQRDVDLM